MNNHGNYIGSLGNVCRWLAPQGRGARRRNLSGLCRGRSAVSTTTARCRASRPATWASARTARTRLAITRGMELRGKYTLFAEGARGSLTKQLIAKFELDANASRRNSASASRSCGRSIPAKHRPGLVQHSFGWPLDNRTGGGSFLYHFDDNLVVDRLRRASQLRESVSVAVRRIPALQDASADPRRRSKAASASPMARAPSPKAASSRCRS